VNLSFRRSSDQAWISIAATAKLNFNEEEIASLWDNSWNAWLDKPEQAVLIELEPFSIDFWEPEMGKLGRLLELAKAHVTDSEPDLSPVKSLHINDKLLATALVGGDR
jgi:general stress protein 26